MANQVFNIAKGRVIELAIRVNNNDPTNAVFLVVVLETTGLQSDATLIDYDTLQAIIDGGSTEPEQAQYNRKTLDQAGGLVVTVDDGNDRTDLDCPDHSWTGVVAGDGWSRLLFCYDSDSGAGTDSAVVPLTSHDFVITPDGTDIIAQIGANGFFRAA